MSTAQAFFLANNDSDLIQSSVDSEGTANESITKRAARIRRQLKKAQKERRAMLRERQRETADEESPRQGRRKMGRSKTMTDPHTSTLVSIKPRAGRRRTGSVAGRRSGDGKAFRRSSII